MALQSGAHLRRPHFGAASVPSTDAACSPLICAGGGRGRTFSPDFFLLIQLGQCYGSCLRPQVVPAALAAQLLAHCSPEGRDAFAAASPLDENAIPPEYV